MAATGPDGRGAAAVPSPTLLRQTRPRESAVRRRRSPLSRLRQPRPRSPSCTTARRCSTLDPAGASTCCSRPAGSAPTGTAYGLDMTDEMLNLGAPTRPRPGPRTSLAQGPYRGHSATRRHRRRRALQLRHQSLDRQALRSSARPRVLRPGGRFAVSDVVADSAMDEATRGRPRFSTWAASPARSRATSTTAPPRRRRLIDVVIVETHRVHEHAARRSYAPAGPRPCSQPAAAC